MNDYKFDFTGKNVVITGALGGFGSKATETFKALGANVIGLEKGPLKERHSHNLDLLIEVDVSDPVSVSDAFHKIDEKYDHIDILINNAGVREIKTILEIEPAEFARVISVNVNGTFYCAREAALRMAKNKSGNIISVASICGVLAMPNRPAYTASKHAIIGLTKNLATDLAAHGIRVNAVAPGTIRTPLTEAYYQDKKFLDDLDSTVPLGAQKGNVDDIINAFLFLASPFSEFVTGTALVVDGGWSVTKAVSYRPDSPHTKSSSSGKL